MLMRILFSKRYKHEEGWFAEGKAATMAEDYRRTGETEASAGKAVSEVRGYCQKYSGAAAGR